MKWNMILRGEMASIWLDVLSECFYISLTYIFAARWSNYIVASTVLYYTELLILKNQNFPTENENKLELNESHFVYRGDATVSLLLTIFGSFHM